MVVETGRAERLPPHDTEAEEAVVASLLVDPEAVYKISPILKPEDFFREKNAWAFEACLALWERGESINQITVAHELARRGRLEEIGGAAYLSKLVTELPTSVGVEHYAGLVQRDSRYRQLISAAGQIAQMAYQAPAGVAEVLARAETLIAAIRQGQSIRDFVHVKELLEGYLSSADQATSSVAAQSRAITTGFMDLDTLLGGLKRTDLVVVAARPSVGKTSLAINFARNAAARQGATVGIFSVEMAGEQLVQRLVAAESGVDSTRLTFGAHTDREQGKIVNALATLSDLNIYFDDTAMLTIAEMRAKARRLHLERGLDLIVVDHIQLMHGGNRNDNRVQEVSYITRSMKELARDLDVPVIACSQLSRAAEARPTHVPQLSDLRDSGSIEQDADVVMFIYREEKHVTREDWQRQHPDRSSENYPAGIAQIIIAKHRNGPTGTIHLRFREKIARFEDLLVREPEEWDGDA
ncbi:MAG: replicative DNA helicase [Dehalococcoidia bacterium]